MLNIKCISLIFSILIASHTLFAGRTLDDTALLQRIRGYYGDSFEGLKRGFENDDLKSLNSPEVLYYIDDRGLVRRIVFSASGFVRHYWIDLKGTAHLLGKEDVPELITKRLLNFFVHAVDMSAWMVGDTIDHTQIVFDQVQSKAEFVRRILEKTLHRADHIERLCGNLKNGQIKLFSDYLLSFPYEIRDYILNGTYVNTERRITLLHIFATVPAEERINGKQILMRLVSSLRDLGANFDMLALSELGREVDFINWARDYNQWDLISALVADTLLTPIPDTYPDMQSNQEIWHQPLKNKPMLPMEPSKKRKPDDKERNLQNSQTQKKRKMNPKTHELHPKNVEDYIDMQQFGNWPEDLI